MSRSVATRNSLWRNRRKSLVRPGAEKSLARIRRCQHCRRCRLATLSQGPRRIRRNRSTRVTQDKARGRPQEWGSEAKRSRYSFRAGRSSKSGSNGSSAASLSMNMLCIARGAMPLASPAAISCRNSPRHRYRRSEVQTEQSLVERDQRADFPNSSQRPPPTKATPLLRRVTTCNSLSTPSRRRGMRSSFRMPWPPSGRLWADEAVSFFVTTVSSLSALIAHRRPSWSAR